MTLRPLAILAAALACAAAAPAHKAPAKAPAKAEAPKAEAPKAAAPAKAAPARPAATPAPPAGPFDATDPKGFMDVLSSAGLQVQTNRHDGDSVFVTVKAPAVEFSMQFAGCNAQSRACRAILFDAGLGQHAVSLTQVNDFNQSSALCRVYLDKGAQPHVIYSTILLASDTRDAAAAHILTWRGCLGDATDFARDPAGYLANAA